MNRPGRLHLSNSTCHRYAGDANQLKLRFKFTNKTSLASRPNVETFQASRASPVGDNLSGLEACQAPNSSSVFLLAKIHDQWTIRPETDGLRLEVSGLRLRVLARRNCACQISCAQFKRWLSSGIADRLLAKVAGKTNNLGLEKLATKTAPIGDSSGTSKGTISGTLTTDLARVLTEANRTLADVASDQIDNGKRIKDLLKTDKPTGAPLSESTSRSASISVADATISPTKSATDEIQRQERSRKASNVTFKNEQMVADCECGCCGLHGETLFVLMEKHDHLEEPKWAPKEESFAGPKHSSDNKSSPSDPQSVSLAAGDNNCNTSSLDATNRARDQLIGAKTRRRQHQADGSLNKGNGNLPDKAKYNDNDEDDDDDEKENDGEEDKDDDSRKEKGTDEEPMADLLETANKSAELFQADDAQIIDNESEDDDDDDEMQRKAAAMMDRKIRLALESAQISRKQSKLRSAASNPMTLLEVVNVDNGNGYDSSDNCESSDNQEISGAQTTTATATSPTTTTPTVTLTLTKATVDLPSKCRCWMQRKQWQRWNQPQQRQPDKFSQIAADNDSAISWSCPKETDSRLAAFADGPVRLLAVITIDALNRFIQLKPDLNELIEIDLRSAYNLTNSSLGIGDGANSLRISKASSLSSSLLPLAQPAEESISKIGNLIYQLESTNGEDATSRSKIGRQLGLVRQHLALPGPQIGRQQGGDNFHSPIGGALRVKLQFDIHFASQLPVECRNLYVKYKLLARTDSASWIIKALQPNASQRPTKPMQPELASGSELKWAQMSHTMPMAGSDQELNESNAANKAARDNGNNYDGNTFELAEGSTITSRPDSSGRFHFACVEQIILELAGKAAEIKQQEQRQNNKWLSSGRSLVAAQSSLTSTLPLLSSSSTTSSSKLRRQKSLAVNDGASGNSLDTDLASQVETDGRRDVDGDHAPILGQQAAPDGTATRDDLAGKKVSSTPRLQSNGNSGRGTGKNTDNDDDDDERDQSQMAKACDGVIGEQSPLDGGNENNGAKSLGEPNLVSSEAEVSRDQPPAAASQGPARDLHLDQPDCSSQLVLLFELYSSDFYGDKLQGWTHLVFPLDYMAPNSTSPKGCQRTKHCLPVVTLELSSAVDKLRYYLTGQLPSSMPSLQSFVWSNPRYMLHTKQSGELRLDCEMVRQFSDPNFDSALKDLLDAGKVSGLRRSERDQHEGDRLPFSGRNSMDGNLMTSLSANNKQNESVNGNNADLDTRRVLEAYRRARQRIERLDLTPLKASL